ncbi:Clustered mitochondria protein homolog [Rhizoctonia solani]|uniref:Clustered mitochondria protein homolog n=1 Tax=Rhizoctonia solani TaxID=456999 RepID=A0A0K6FPI7_9AGAM|nr:Clustered mitochondria protein homolog [Rhizoctonia solani]
MTDELETATTLLSSALDRYSEVCSRLKDCYPPNTLPNIPPEYTSRVLREFALVTTYETEIRHLKALFGRLNNSTELSGTRSIGSFPPEVLAHIFKIVCSTGPCPQSATYAYTTGYKPPLFNTDSITLSHVCSRWRQIAINTATMWSHIDLVPHQFQVTTLSERTNTYLARAGRTLLDIHLVDRSHGAKYDAITGTRIPLDSGFLEFFASIAPQMRSFELRTNYSLIDKHLGYHVLSVCFAKCIPGTLQQLSFDVAKDYGDFRRSPESELMGIPEETVERLWRSVTVLRLKQFYPKWTSQLYHGLVELCLAGQGLDASISEARLVAIMKSSPRLRVLKIGFEITHAIPIHSPVEQISLIDLEHLDSGWIREQQLGILLRWIAPGTKPLSFKIVNPWLGAQEGQYNPMHFTSRSEVESFFARSNVTRLYAVGFDHYNQLVDVLSMAPSVRVLVVDGFTCNQVNEEHAPPPGVTLDELYVNGWLKDIVSGSLLYGGSNNVISPEFANRIIQELSIVASYESEIRESRATVSQLHNLGESRNTRSIFSLPTEVLARIFRTVCNIHPCPQSGVYTYSTYSKPLFVLDPIILSHVCSHWREVATNSPDLWSHIDLVPDQLRLPGWSERATTYVARSGQTLLDIHISPTPEKKEVQLGSLGTDPDFLQFLARIAPRMRSLTMSANHPPAPGMLCHSVLSTCFANCVPGRLVSLDFDFDRGHVHPLLEDETNTDTSLPREKLESLWYHIKSLRVDHFHPAWTSKAYHGLLELELNGIGSIPESVLVAILKSSPGLRVLKLQCQVTDRTPDDTRITPVPLVDLEQLTATPFEELDLGYILRLIAPGAKPLGFTLTNPWLGSTTVRPRRFTSKVETRNFFFRAKVTRLYAKTFDNYKQIEYVLAMVPSVRVLVLDGCRCRQVREGSILPVDFTLDELYVLRSTDYGAVTWSSIEWMVERFRIRELTLWWYDHRYNGLGESGAPVVPNNLHTICPKVNVISDESPNPIKDWQ